MKLSATLCVFLCALCVDMSAAVAKKTTTPKPAATKSAATKSATRPSPVFSNTYASPRSKERPARKSTQFIILHTTEGGRDGSLAKLRRNGECHYVVDKAGVIYRIVDRRKVAFHCGLSMWNNLTGLDRHAIGIEIVGYHNQEITSAQYASLKYLLADLKRIYKVPDERVLTHSMVAYGAPNAFHKRNHRGRKRCGMLFADPNRRRRLGLLAKPAFDPDLKAGRLADADPALTRILYAPAKTTTPAKTATPAKPTAPVKTTTPTKPTTPAKPATPTKTTTPAKPAAPAKTTAPAKTVAPAAEPHVIGPHQSAWDIARDRYNAPTTLYRFPDGSRKKGSEIRDWKSLPAGTIIELPK